MKPRQKVVTAEDIQSSLYFLHMNSPEDERSTIDSPSSPETEYGQHSPVAPPHSLIQRKAVPNGPMTTLPPRKPVPGTLAPVNGFENRQNIVAGDYARSSPNSLGPDYTPRRSFDSLQPQDRSRNQRPVLHVRGRSEQLRHPGTFLTLIRRDPASGAQWNIARIDDPPALDISSTMLAGIPYKKPIGAPIYIDITNPGYSKFLHTSSEGPAPSRLQSNDDELFLNPNDATLDRQNNVHRFHGEKASNTFRRRLWMEGTKDLGGGFGHRRLNSHDSNMSSPRSSIEVMQRSSADLQPLTALSHENQPYGPVQLSEKQTSFRGYVFMSPWNGRCEFSTGAGGGSLKVRTRLPIFS